MKQTTLQPEQGYETDKGTVSISGGAEFSLAERQMLLKIAADSIDHGLDHKKPLPIDPAAFPPALREKYATFVTLEKGGQLRGCIGSLQAARSLVEDIAYNAFQSAFRDPRFSRLTRAERSEVEIDLSVLTPAEPMAFDSETDLIGKLRPGVDGLILASGTHRGTFLPSVWESLPEPAQFLRHLKMKAGLAPDAWPSDVAVSRYSAQVISE